MEDTPLNVQHIQRVNNGQTLPEKIFVPASQFEFSNSPFTELLTVILKSIPSYPYPTFEFTYKDDDLLKRDSAKTVQPKYPVYSIFYNPRSTNNNLRCSFVTSIHGNRVFNSSDSLKQIHLLKDKGVLELSIRFALEKELSFKEVREATNKYGLF